MVYHLWALVQDQDGLVSVGPFTGTEGRRCRGPSNGKETPDVCGALIPTKKAGIVCGEVTDKQSMESVAATHVNE